MKEDCHRHHRRHTYWDHGGLAISFKGDLYRHSRHCCRKSYHRYHVHGESTRKRRLKTVPTIHKDIISLILTRLPTKILLRFKLTCKSWYGIISDPYFISSHYDQAKKRFAQLIVMHRGHDAKSQREISMYNYWVNKPVARLLCTKKFAEGDEGPLRPHHSNGLLLFVHHTRLVVCNPILKEFVTLPKGYTSTFPRSLDKRVGFGFIPSANLCKVAQYFYRCYDFRTRIYSIGMGVFTLGDDSWRTTTEDPPYPVLDRSPVSIDGAVYWLIDYRFHNMSSPKAILCFNLKDENFTAIPPPLSLSNGDLLESGDLAELGGDLCIFRRTYDGYEWENLDIWMYRPCEVSVGAWNHGFSINLYPLPKLITPIALLYGVLFCCRVKDSYSLEMLEWYDSKNQSLRPIVHTAYLAFDNMRKNGSYSFFDTRSAFQEPRLLPTPDSPRRLRKILFHNPQIDVPAPAADVPDSGPLWSFTETQEPLPPWEYVDTIIAGSCSIRRYFHGTSFIQSQMLRFFNADGARASRSQDPEEKCQRFISMASWKALLLLISFLDYIRFTNSELFCGLCLALIVCPSVLPVVATRSQL